jgi:type I restriction enzyme S subunit
MSSEVVLNLFRLGDIGEFKNGANFSQEDYGPGYPIVNVKQLYGGRYIQLEGLESLGKDVLKRPEQLFLTPGDILFARSSVKRSGAGQCALVPDGVVNTIFSGFIIRYRLNDKSTTNPMFLSYLLQSPVYREIFQRIATGTTISNLSQDALKGVEVNLPEVGIQNQVAAILGALDDRITLLRETNTTLEAIAQALFKSWFVDFDPVHAKMQGRAPEGMDEATAALFPDSFEDSELGAVPKGWGVGTLADLATFQNGYAFKSKDWTEAGHPVIKIGNVKPGVISFDGCSYVGSESVVGLERFRLERGDLLVGMTGYVGETGLVTEVSPAAYLNQRVGRIATTASIKDLGFVFCLTRHENFKAFAEGQSHGSAQANVSGSDLLKFKSVIPSDKVVRAFNEVMETLIESIMSNHEQAQLLAMLRDSLLPRLISGQLRIEELLQ